MRLGGARNVIEGREVIKGRKISEIEIKQMRVSGTYDFLSIVGQVFDGGSDVISVETNGKNIR